jgi:NADH-quinone oxidoreductase subunit G
MVSVTIDNINIQVQKNSTILEACDFAGIIVPRFCFHEKLNIAGNCRMCIVEIEKFPKPVSSCTMNVSEGMSIFTKTPLVQKAQESVLEFLLINHPLDCPICDQGGECDLQDQLFFFGSDTSRFFKYKRSVEDKNCSLLIKTIMTRCIHCTRCVRFLSEISGDSSIGILGRSSKSEIGLYIEKNLESEFSGNVIDLCPVGALTSKVYSFKSRPWELTDYVTIDILDGLGSSIILSLKGSSVMRVLPGICESINSEWISDRTRFFYDSFDYLRIKKPWCSSSKRFITWSDFFSKDNLCLNLFSSKKKLGVILGNSLDAESAVVSNSIFNLMGSSEIYSENAVSSHFKDLREDYLFKSSLKGLDSSDVCLLIGCDTLHEAPSLDLRLRQQVTRKDTVVGYVGPSLDLRYEALHLGLGVPALESLLRGSHPFSCVLKKSKNVSIIIGASASLTPSHIVLLKHVFRTKYGCAKAQLNFLSLSSGSVAMSEIGLRSFNTTCLKKYDLLFLVGVNDMTRYLSYSKNIIYVGSHYSIPGLQQSKYIIPSPLFFEKQGKYWNTEGRLRSTSMLRMPSLESRSEWSFFYKLYAYKKGLSFKRGFLSKVLRKEYPSLYLGQKPSILLGYSSFFTVFLGRKCSYSLFKRFSEDFYVNNFLTNSSKNLLLCSKNRTKNTFLNKKK